MNPREPVARREIEQVQTEGRRRKESNKVFLGTATAILTAAVLYGVSSAWAGKLDVSTFARHTAQHALDRQLDSVWRAQQDAKITEVLCAVKPRSPRCQ